MPFQGPFFGAFDFSLWSPGLGHLGLAENALSDQLGSVDLRNLPGSVVEVMLPEAVPEDQTKNPPPAF